MTEKTTLRRNETENVKEGARRLAIVWVFPELGGRIDVLHAGRTVVGRDFSCDIRLPGDETSRQHAEIVRESAMTVIADLDSTNGVYVDGRRAPRAPLDEGSVVRIGDWVGVLARVAGELEGPVFQELAPGYFAGPRTREALAPLRTAAASDLSIIIEGETGTGKEGVARAAHLWSGRTGPFIAVNCAALPEALAEGELFGYRKGSFTSADRASPGYFQAAHRGTLFLDEVADLAPKIQPKLLRALEQKEVTPLGEAKAVAVDVRVVVAAQAPLTVAVRDQRFRADLFARLDGLRVTLAPLRARVEEVPYLFSRLLAARAEGRPVPQMDAAFVERLCLHRWPLNIRELVNLARRLLALHAGEKLLKRAHLAGLTDDDLSAATPAPAASPDDAEALASDGTPLPAAQLAEKRHILEVLDQCAGSQTEAARLLNMSRGTLIERLKRYGIRRPRADREA
jgi:two-component system, NtrC family, response regulator AtoC